MASIVNVEVSAWSQTTSKVITKPSGVAIGDTLVAVVANSTTAVTPSAPAGWTDITAFSTSFGSSDFTAKAFFRKATSDDVSATDYTFTGSDRMVGVIVAIRSTTAIQAPSYDLGYTGGVTPLSANSCLIFANIATDNDMGGPSVKAYTIATSNPTWTERYDNLYEYSGGIKYYFALATAIRPETTPTGDFDVTYDYAPNLGEAGCLVVVHSAIDSSTTLDAVTATTSAQTMTAIGGMTTTLDVATTTVTAPDMTGAKADWSYEDKPSTTTWTYIDK